MADQLLRHCMSFMFVKTWKSKGSGKDRVLTFELGHKKTHKSPSKIRRDAERKRNFLLRKLRGDLHATGFCKPQPCFNSPNSKMTSTSNSCDTNNPPPNSCQSPMEFHDEGKDYSTESSNSPESSDFEFESDFSDALTDISGYCETTPNFEKELKSEIEKELCPDTEKHDCYGNSMTEPNVFQSSSVLSSECTRDIDTCFESPRHKCTRPASTGSIHFRVPSKATSYKSPDTQNIVLRIIKGTLRWLGFK